MQHSGESFESKGRPAPAAISIPVDNDTNHARRKEHSTLALHVLDRLAGNSLTGADEQAYRLLIKIYQACGWDGLLGVRSQVFLMEEEFHPSQPLQPDEKEAATLEFFSNSPILAPNPSLLPGKAVDLVETEKRVCERWLDRIFSVLFEDLRVYEVFAKELKEKRVSLKAGREWFLLGRLCLRLQKEVT